MTEAMLVTPRIRPDEWWIGYQARFLAANGLFHQTFPGSLGGCLPDFGSLPDQHQATPNHGTNHGRWGRFLVPRWSLHSIRACSSFCPRCWEEEPYVRLDWRLKECNFCMRHGCALVAQCPKCHCQLGVVDVVKGRCSAGHPLRGAGMQTSSVPEPQLALGATSLSACSDIEVASALLLVHLSTRLAEASGEDERAELLMPAALVTQQGQRLLPLDCEAIERLLVGLACPAHLDQALCIVLSIHRSELAFATVMSSLPLWGFAQMLARRGASLQGAVSQGLLDRHALVAAADEAAASRRGGMGFGRHSDDAFRDNVLLTGSPEGLALRGFEDWRARQALEAVPIVEGADVRMHPYEFEEYLADVLRIAKPMEMREEAAVRLDLPQLWERNSRRRVAEVLDGLRSGKLPVWIRGDRSGLSSLYVGSDVLKLLDQSTARWPKRPMASQLSLAF